MVFDVKNYLLVKIYNCCVIMVDEIVDDLFLYIERLWLMVVDIVLVLY